MLARSKGRGKFIAAMSRIASGIYRKVVGVVQAAPERNSRPGELPQQGSVNMASNGHYLGQHQGHRYENESSIWLPLRREVHAGTNTARLRTSSCIGGGTARRMALPLGCSRGRCSAFHHGRRKSNPNEKMGELFGDNERKRVGRKKKKQKERTRPEWKSILTRLGLWGKNLGKNKLCSSSK